MKIFVCYCRDDMELKNQLLKRIAHLKSSGIELWHDLLIEPGSNWRDNIDARLNEADAAFFLVSNSFLESSFCQEVEVPKLQEKGLKIYPIILRHSNYEQYPDFEKLALMPLDDFGRVKPFAEHNSNEKDKFCTKLGKLIFDDKRLRSNSVVNNGNANKKIEIKLDEAEDQRFAEQLARSYYDEPTSSLKKLISGYAIRNERSPKWAESFFQIFKSQLESKGTRISNRIHKDIMELLEVGLPEEPVHLSGITSPTAETLLAPGYASLLRGIRLTEIDYDKAITHLQVMAHEWKYPDCALLKYALGQCYRKLGNLGQAVASLEVAVDRINNWSSDHCSCGPGCSKDRLSVQIHRGLGAVYRKQQRFAKAEEEFQKSESLITAEIPNAIKSEFFYSYGYYLYERSYQVFRLNNEQTGDFEEYSLRLNLAKEKFQQSLKLNQKWNAPAARLQIVKQLLGDMDYDGYLKALDLTESDTGIESKLTGVICKFAVLCEDIQIPDLELDRNFNSQQLFEDLYKLFLTTIIPKGARTCHSFDITAILDQRDIKRDIWLNRVYNLITQSSTWNYKSLEVQKEKVHEFCILQGIKQEESEYKNFK